MASLSTEAIQEFGAELIDFYSVHIGKGSFNTDPWYEHPKYWAEIIQYELIWEWIFGLMKLLQIFDFSLSDLIFSSATFIWLPGGIGTDGGKVLGCIRGEIKFEAVTERVEGE